MVKAIIFDFDGVIVESTDIKTEAFAKLFQSEGADIVSKIVTYHKSNMGVSRFDKFRYIYSKILLRELDDDKFKSLCERFALLVKDAVIRAPYVKGAYEFLEKNSGLYLFFIVSATPYDEISDIVRQRRLDRIFKSVHGAPLVKRDAVSMILQRERITPFDAVYVGDAMSDYIAAVDNCVNFIARIKDNEELFKRIDCLKMDDFLELPALLDDLKYK